MDDIIKGALERYQESEASSDYNRQAAHEDIRFARLSEQWPDDIKRLRELENRPCLTINKLPAFIRQVVNDARQNKPGIKVSPVDNGADEDTAEVIQGLTRSIERKSNADVAYDTAIDHAVTGGFGFFRIGIDYAHEDSFDLEAYIKRIPNPLMVHWDVNSMEADASDWEYAFIADFLTKEQFKREFPDAEPASWEHSDYQDYAQHWMQEDQIRVSEYWLREKDEKDLILFKTADGELPKAIREDNLPRMAKMAAEAAELPLDGMRDDEIVRMYIQFMGLEESRRRKVDVWNVKNRIINANEVLREEEWPGPTIPICPVWGEEVVVDGRRYFRSMIRDAKDPQSMFNFWRTAATELVALAPKAPWVGPVGFVPDGQQGKWDTANTRSYAYLEYDPTAGNAPQRQPPASIPTGALQEAANASDDMKSIMSIYDSSLGAQSNETSGKAILARQRESDVSNFHFVDNLNRAIRYAGQCIVDIIPSVYSARQTIRILGEDEAEKVVKLTQQDGGGEVGEDGKPELYNLSVGRYDVTVSSGPSYATQREETRETLVEIMRAVPGSAQFIGDVLMEHMDFQGADKVAERLKMLLPPNIQQAEGLPVQQPMVAPGQPGVPPEGTPPVPQGPMPGQPPIQ